MKVLAIVSAKGGVGKTTLAANIGVGMADRGRSVLLLDLDPQNALQWHLGSLEPGDTEGIAHAADGELANYVYTSPFGVDFIPFGVADEHARQSFETRLEQQPGWLRAQLQCMELPAETVVIIDTQPGPTVYLSEVLRTADIVLVVLLADMASYATITEMESLLATYVSQNKGHSVYVLNQMHDSDLAREIVTSMQHNLGDRVAPCLIPDRLEVEEALGFERPILQYDPQNPAAKEMRRLIDFLLTPAMLTGTAADRSKVSIRT